MGYSLALSAFVFLTGLLTVSGQGMHCYSCSGSTNSRYGNDNQCVANVSSARTVSCRSGYYCLTQFSINNGVLSRVRRTCQNPNTDHDATTNDAPTEDGCVSSYSRYNVQGNVQCYYHCTSTRCNKLTPRTFLRCSQDCAGQCDPVTGACAATKRCVQCNDEGSEDCDKKTKATPCPKRQNNYCATTRITTFANDMEVIRTSVTKSCATIRSNNIPRKRCQFVTNSLYNVQPFISYVCSDFCTDDECNGNIGSPEPDRDSLRCVVCSEQVSTTHCERKTQTTVCPNDATYCKSTVTYYVTEELGNGQLEHKIAKIRRECSSEAVKPSCTSKRLDAPGLNIVTCEETCSTPGCNVGWPARPRCSQCNGTNSTSENESCKIRPRTPSMCASPAHAYCFTKSLNTENVPGYSATVERGCSVTDIGTSCTTESFSDTTISNCQTSCDSDGCNQGLLPNPRP